MGWLFGQAEYGCTARTCGSPMTSRGIRQPRPHLPASPILTQFPELAHDRGSGSRARNRYFQPQPAGRWRQAARHLDPVGKTHDHIHGRFRPRLWQCRPAPRIGMAVPNTYLHRHMPPCGGVPHRVRCPATMPRQRPSTGPPARRNWHCWRDRARAAAIQPAFRKPIAPDFPITTSASRIGKELAGPWTGQRHHSAAASLSSMTFFRSAQGWFATFSPPMTKVGVASILSALAFCWKVAISCSTLAVSFQQAVI